MPRLAIKDEHNSINTPVSSNPIPAIIFFIVMCPQNLRF
jgi:hypothetical protein